MAEALDELGGGGDGSIGVSWADPQLVRRSGGGPALMDLALGPNAGTVVEAAPRLRERFGLDPLAAERLVAIGGSYAFGLRIDGVDGGELASELVADGGHARRSGDLRLIEIGDYAVVPDALLDAGSRASGHSTPSARGSRSWRSPTGRVPRCSARASACSTSRPIAPRSNASGTSSRRG